MIVTISRVCELTPTGLNGQCGKGRGAGTVDGADRHLDGANFIIDNHPIALLFRTIIGFFDDELISLGFM